MQTHLNFMQLKLWIFLLKKKKKQMVEYTCDVVKATLHRVLPISPGSSSFAPHPHLNLSAGLLDSWARNFPGRLSLPRLLHPSSWPAEFSSRTQIGCHLLLKDLPLPRLGFSSLPPWRHVFPSFRLSAYVKTARMPRPSVSLTGPVITHMDPQAQTWHSDRISRFLASTIWALLAFKIFFAFIAKNEISRDFT